MVITWVTAFLLLNIEKINKQAFCQMFISGYWLFSFANQVQEHFYSWMLFMLWAFFGPSSPMRTFKQNDHSDKNKNTSDIKQNDDSDENKMTIATKKWQFWQNTASLTLFTRFMRFFQSRALNTIFYRASFIYCIQWPHYQKILCYHHINSNINHFQTLQKTWERSLMKRRKRRYVSNHLAL